MAALTASCIDLNIQGNGAYSVLKQLATMALQNGFITDSHQFLQTLLLREKMHSTGSASACRKAAKRIRSKSSAHYAAKLSTRILSTNCDRATPTRCLLC